MTSVDETQKRLTKLRQTFNSIYDEYFNNQTIANNLDIKIVESTDAKKKLNNDNNNIAGLVTYATNTYRRAIDIQKPLISKVDALFLSNAFNLSLYNTLTKQDNLLQNYNSILDTNNLKEQNNIFNHIKNQNTNIKKQTDYHKMKYKIDNSNILYLKESDDYYNTIATYLFIIYFICYIFLIYILIVVRKDMNPYYKLAILLFFLAYPFLLKIINAAFSNSWNLYDIYEIYAVKVLVKYFNDLLKIFHKVFSLLSNLFNLYIAKTFSNFINLLKI